MVQMLISSSLGHLCMLLLTCQVPKENGVNKVNKASGAHVSAAKPGAFVHVNMRSRQRVQESRDNCGRENQKVGPDRESGFSPSNRSIDG